MSTYESGFVEWSGGCRGTFMKGKESLTYKGPATY